MNEICWFIYGLRFGEEGFIGFKRFHSRGDGASVEFDWKSAMNPFLLGWLHSHPDSCGTSLSDVDYKTLRSWVRACGRPFLYGVTCDGKTSWGWFRRGGVPGGFVEKTIQVRNFDGLLIGSKDL